MSPRILFIGGTDSSGGAGLSRDVATAARLGADAALAVTSVTAQTARTVTAIHHLPPEHITAQIATAGTITAVKTGMLATAAIVEATASALPDAPLVIDPVIASSSGHALLDPEGVEALLTRLIPRAVLVTPNLPELVALCHPLGLGTEASDQDRAQALLALGCDAVLVKGGHAATGPICCDRLFTTHGMPPQCFRGPRFAISMRGTGCRLASGIVVFLAKGLDLPDAVSRSRTALLSAFAEEGTGEA